MPTFRREPPCRGRDSKGSEPERRVCQEYIADLRSAAVDALDRAFQTEGKKPKGTGSSKRKGP